MPSAVHISASLAARKIALVSQSVQEQLTGLVNVSLEYVTTAANRDGVAAMFYLDAPPPIFPNCINKFELQNRALYMISRNITQANGLVTISAEYAGGLKRGGIAPMLISTERDGPNGYSFIASEAEPIFVQNWPNAPDYTNSNTTTFNYFPSESLSYYSIVYTYTFVDIDGLRPILPPLGPLFNIISYSKTSYTTRFIEGRNTIVNQSVSSNNPDFNPNSPFNLPYWENQLSTRTVVSDEKPSFITPMVKLMTIRKYIN